MKWLSFEATGSVAYKEFLHILRDRRVLLSGIDSAAAFHASFWSCL